jgi:hypothetical protein
MEKTIGALRRSLVGLQRICEDLEGLDESEHRWISRACALDEVLHLALDQLAGESPGEKWRAVEIESKAPVVVLGDPWQLQGAFVRILHEIRVRGDRSRALRVAISTRGSASLVRFEFYCQREPEDQPELYFVTARGSHSAPAGYSLSTGMRAATRTISRCGGEVRVERAESAEGIVLVVLLPLAPSLQ